MVCKRKSVIDYFFNFNRKQCLEKSCDYVFSVDSLAMLDHAHTLQKLIEVNRSVYHTVSTLFILYNRHMQRTLYDTADFVINPPILCTYIIGMW